MCFLKEQRCQGETETAEQFIASLYNLATDCEFGELKEQLIRTVYHFFI